MDAHRFDSFARATARCTTRRQVLRVVAAGVLAGWLPRSARAAAFQEAGPCGGLTDCGGVCVELRGDPLNCGGCGIACAAGESCVDGGCLLIEFPPEAPTGCNEGLTLCNGECLVIDGGDPFNCGGCGVACAAGGSCFNGVCVPPEEVPPQPGGCGEGMPSCGGVCTDLLTDPLNCGACGVVCADSACAGGECGAPPGPCAPGFTDCGGSCVDLLTSNGNCGTCGTICELGETCGGGGACVPAVVACPDGQPPCGEVCADKNTDPNNCGACGVVCGDDEACFDGVCVPPASVCGAGRTDCGGRCVNLGADVANCGACGFVCALNAKCTNGECLCPDDWGYCEAVGACYDFAADPDNCGGCGVGCAAGEACEDGACVAARPQRTPTRTTSKAVLGWPFDPREGQWAIVNGYRGTGQHAAATDGKPNPARFALDFARCGDDSIDVGRGICANASDELGWDRVATRGATVLSPIDGTIAYVGELTPTCPYVAIAVPDRPGYEVVLVNVAGAPTDGEVVRGDPIGTVAAGTCGEAGDGDYLLMAVYARFDGDEPDPNAAAEGVPFADDWEIDGCAYPDNKRTANQYLGELVPCQPPSTGQSRANA